MRRRRVLFFSPAVELRNVPIDYNNKVVENHVNTFSFGLKLSAGFTRKLDLEMEGMKSCHKERRNKSHNFTERLYLISILLKFLEDKTTFPYHSIDEMSRMHFVLKINKQCILITFNCQYAMEIFLPICWPRRNSKHM